MVTNRNNNILENHEIITLNKDDDIGGSQFQLCGNVFPLQYHLLNKLSM